MDQAVPAGVGVRRGGCAGFTPTTESGWDASGLHGSRNEQAVSPPPPADLAAVAAASAATGAAVDES